MDEAAQRVTVQAGVPTRMLLDYLAAYTCACTCSWRATASLPDHLEPAAAAHSLRLLQQCPSCAQALAVQALRQHGALPSL